LVIQNFSLVLGQFFRRRPGSQSEIHTSFKISANGEALLLSNAQGHIIDAVRLGRMDDDTTLGRAESIGPDWFEFQSTSTTPGKINASEGGIFIEAPSFSRSPGLSTIHYPLKSN
jgi:hypothetical protein